MFQKLLYLILMILQNMVNIIPPSKRRKSLWVITCQVTQQVNDTAGMKTPAMTISQNLSEWPADTKDIESLCIMKSFKYVRLSLKTWQITRETNNSQYLLLLKTEPSMYQYFNALGTV